jgi:hypothetical protein
MTAVRSTRTAHRAMAAAGTQGADTRVSACGHIAILLTTKNNVFRF